ncbi:hypothetical protein QF001_004716 [Paraburkholderia youngii]
MCVAMNRFDARRAAWDSSHHACPAYTLGAAFRSSLEWHSGCGRSHDGITPASCWPTNSERQLERFQPPHDTRQPWV